MSAAMLIAGISKRRELRAFVVSNLLLGSLLASGGAATFPVMLHSTLDPGILLNHEETAEGANLAQSQEASMKRHRRRASQYGDFHGTNRAC